MRITRAITVDSFSHQQQEKQDQVSPRFQRVYCYEITSFLERYSMALLSSEIENYNISLISETINLSVGKIVLFAVIIA